MTVSLGKVPVDSLIRIYFSTSDKSGGRVAPSSAFEAADVRIYKDGSATQRSSESGFTMTSPFDSMVGMHALGVDLSDNTDAGFYAAGNDYAVVLTPDETVDGQRAAEIGLTNVSLTSDKVIGEVDAGFDALQAAIGDATLAVCAEAVGIMSVLTEKTIEYAKSRVQFGVPISSFQALQHRMVEMYTACEQSRSLLMWTAMALADGTDDSEKAVHSLKYQIGIAGTLVGEEAVQIHGGMGVTWELDVAHFFKRLTAINLMFGNADWHLDRLSGATD